MGAASEANLYPGTLQRGSRCIATLESQSLFECCLPRQRVTSYFLAHEAPEEPDATFFKQFEEVGARAVFAGLSKEDQDSYRHISEMELAGYAMYCQEQERRRSGGIADDSSSDDEEEAFERLSDEDTRDFIVLVL